MEHISAKNRSRAREITAKLTLDEKARLHAGLGPWHTQPIERLGLESIAVADGPHGLRKEIDASAPTSQENTVKATCFPTAVAASCSFDRGLLYEMGIALAEEALAEGVNVILGPAANIKRSPLCGRNFEYISEDPYVAGEFATALINGIQSKNVGTSLKHFLGNNQETARLSSSSVIDERALREIYMPAFEAAVKNAQPYTIMCSYNRINGTYASNNKRMLTDILRNEWGFEGIVMTDWGAMADRAESIRAGIDLEMPGRGADFDIDITEAVRSGDLSEKELDECTERLIALVLQTIDNKKESYSREAHHKLAGQIARESAVLLRNEKHTLPLEKTAKIAVCGAFAKNPRYQGAGSSLIAPYVINAPVDELKARGISFVYSEAINRDGDTTDEAMLQAAVDTASKDDIDAIVAFVGLPDSYESEGYDRTHMRMPESHNNLIHELSQLNKPVIAVILAGSAVEIPWREEVDSILLMNLSGQNIGSAVVDLLFGDYSPCGKLTETYPLSLTETPSNETFGDRYNIEYKESIFVGYRYYDTANHPVAYPFGHGLSYVEFEYSDIRLSASEINDIDELRVTAKVKNTGNMTAKEIVQLYISAPKLPIFRASHELRNFCKIELAPNEETQVEFILKKRDFAYYNVNISDWHVLDGKYIIEIAASSRDIRLQAEVTVHSTADAPVPDYRSVAPSYYNLPEAGELHIPHEEFAELFADKSVLKERNIRPFNKFSTLHDLQTSAHGKRLADKIVAEALSRRGGKELPEEYYYAPMCSSMFPRRGLNRNKIKGMILYANGFIEEGEKLINDN